MLPISIKTNLFSITKFHARSGRGEKLTFETRGHVPSAWFPALQVSLLLPLSHCQCQGSADKMSCVVRKPAFCICENKDADQLCGNREADQRLCFHYIDSTIPLLSKSEISRL